MTGTKERIMTAGAELFRRNGYTGTGLKQIVSEANAPFGSLYHFFPGGKEQLGEEIIRTSGMQYIQILALFLTPERTLLEGLEASFAGAAVTLQETDYADACPIATVALEVAGTNDTLRIATADVFTAWTEAGTKAFRHYGLSEDAARTLTITFVTSLEGAFILCRALRNTEALAIAGSAVVDVARRLLQEAGLL